MLSRREMIQRAAFTAAAMTTTGLFAEELSRTPRQVEGPFARQFRSERLSLLRGLGKLDDIRAGQLHDRQRTLSLILTTFRV